MTQEQTDPDALREQVRVRYAAAAATRITAETGELWRMLQAHRTGPAILDYGETVE